MKYALRHGPLDGANVELSGNPLEFWLRRPHSAYWVLDGMGNIMTDVRANLYTRKEYCYHLFMYPCDDTRKTHYRFDYGRYGR